MAGICCGPHIPIFQPASLPEHHRHGRHRAPAAKMSQTFAKRSRLTWIKHMAAGEIMRNEAPHSIDKYCILHGPKGAGEYQDQFPNSFAKHGKRKISKHHVFCKTPNIQRESLISQKHTLKSGDGASRPFHRIWTRYKGHQNLLKQSLWLAWLKLIIDCKIGKLEMNNLPNPISLGNLG